MNFYPLTVSQVVDETPLARSFELRPADEHVDLFAYKPGQFLTFRIPWQGAHMERCYSLCTAPCSDRALKVTVKRVEGGKGSNWFNDTLRPGDVLDVAPPSGRFVMRNRDRPLVLFAGGSGITPVISIIKQALYETDLSARLLYANANRDQIIFRQELERLCADFPGRLQCRHHLDAEKGLVTSDVISDFVGDRLDSDFFICGPAPFMDLAENVLGARGVEDRRIFIERFTSPDDPSNADAPVSMPEADCKVLAFRATLDDEEHKVPYQAGQTLLDCMLNQGLDPVHSCKDAHCGSCMVIKKSGEVIMRKSTVLSKRDKAKGYILLCQAIPQSDDVWVDCDA